MLDRRHVRRQGSRSYTPLLLYVFPVLHQIRLSVDTPTQDPSLGVEASCFALPRGAVETLLWRSMRNGTPRFWGCPAQAQNSPVFDLEIAPNPIFVCAGQRISAHANVSLTETSAPICPSALCLFPGAEDPSRSLGIAVLTSDFMRRGRKRGSLARGHAAYMRTLKDVRELPNGPPEARFCVGERSMNAHFFTIPPQFKPILGS